MGTYGFWPVWGMEGRRMAFDLSLSSLIRAGSGFVFVAVGALSLAFARASKAGIALAVFCVAWALGFIVVNPLAGDAALLPWGLAIQGIMLVAAAAALLVFHIHAPWRAAISKRDVFVAGAITIALTAWAEIGTSAPSNLRVTQIGGYQSPVAAQFDNLGVNVVLGSA